MKPIVVKIHSFIDVITNSSTEIFVSTHSKTVEYAKELVDEILKASGSDKKSDDVFEIKEVDGSLMLLSKEERKEAIDLEGKLRSIFDIDAEYDG